MNYDGEVPANWATWATDLTDSEDDDPNARDPLDELDCSPHPFDVIAINALYQTAPRVVIEGPVRGAELTDVQFTVGQESNLAHPYTYEWTMSWPGLQFSPDNESDSVSIRLPDVDASDPVEQRRVTIEVKVTDSEGNMTRDSHEIEVRW